MGEKQYRCVWRFEIQNGLGRNWEGCGMLFENARAAAVWQSAIPILDLHRIHLHRAKR
jgi:hypothetical protein